MSSAFATGRGRIRRILSHADPPGTVVTDSRQSFMNVQLYGCTQVFRVQYSRKEPMKG
eukprot:COSAG03_NODE_98_length_13005_cov_17.216953_13_plen_58_part_00